MKKVSMVVAGLCLVASSLLTTGCAKLDKSSVQASNQLPEGSYVKEISIPYDPKFPKYVVAVEPFNMNSDSTVVESNVEGSRHCRGGNCSATTQVKTVGNGVAGQLTTALTNAGNMVVTEMTTVKKTGGGTYSTRIGHKEKGPYIIKGVVTEFTEAAEGSEEGTDVSLGWLGVVGGAAGAISGNDALMWSGAGLAAANPSFEATERSKTGMVAFDIQIIDGKTGRIVKGFKAAGTFTAKSAVNGMSLFGIGQHKSEFAQSCVGQAMRVAMNDAVVKISDSLKGL